MRSPQQTKSIANTSQYLSTVSGVLHSAYLNIDALFVTEILMKKASTMKVENEAPTIRFLHEFRHSYITMDRPSSRLNTTLSFNSSVGRRMI
jgi:hypothetical protein